VTEVAADTAGWRTRRAAYAADPRYRWRVLAVLMVGVFSSAFPTTLLSASLPLIRDDLRTTLGVITWVSTAPALAFAVGMPFFGKLGDLHGHRRTFILGFLGVAATALGTALSWNAASLITIRTVGQLSGAATSTAAFALIAATFEREERAKAIGMYTSVLALSPVIAVVAGGPLIEQFGWRLLFVAQAVPAVLASIVAIPVLPETDRRPAERFDVPGALTLGLGVTSILFAVNRAKPWGWDHPLVLGSTLLGPVLLALFVKVERHTTTPLLPLDYFRRRNFSTPIATNMLVQFAYIGGFTVAPFMVKALFGYSTYKTALVVAVRPVLFSVGSSLAGRHDERYGPRPIQIIANTVLATGTLLTAFAAWHRSIGLTLLSLAVVGFGVGYGRPANTAAVANAVDTGDVGIATGVHNMASSLGGATGTTVCLAIVGESGEPGVFALAALACVAATVVSILTGGMIESRERPRRARTA
jgi:MFS family permease